MRAQIVPRDGDTVLVRGKVIANEFTGHRPLVNLNAKLAVQPHEVEIVQIETANYQIGDPVIAQGHHRGEIIAIYEDGRQDRHFWLKPLDAPKQVPWQVRESECRRAPEPPPSAEVFEWPDKLMPGADAAE